MEYVYGAMLLHSAGQDVSEDNVTKVIEASGVKVDKAKVKALVASLKDVNIDEAIEKAAPVAQAAPVAEAPVAQDKPEESKEEKQEEKVTEEEAASGLASLFG